MADDDELKLKLAHLERLYCLEYEMVRATAAFEHATLRPLFLLNGGALVTYLALYGALNRPGGAAALDTKFAAVAIGCWVVGLLLAMICAFRASQSQYAYRKLRGRQADRKEYELGIQTQKSLEKIEQEIGAQIQIGQSAHKWAVVIGVLSLTAFVIAIYPAFKSIPDRPVPTQELSNAQK